MAGSSRRAGERERRAAAWLLLAVSGVTMLAAATGAASAAPATAPGGTRSAVLTGIRFWTGPESTRLVLETTRPVTFTAGADTVQRTVKILLEGVVPSPDVAPRREVNDGAVRAIRVSETPAGVEVDVDVAEMPAAAPFSVSDGGGESPRLILDVPRPGLDARRQAQERIVRDLGRSQVRVVVVDPGHGGEHPGAIGPRHTVEKDVCLAIARRLAERLGREPGVRVFLTRDGDFNVALRDRSRYAERLQADAFVSIHANSGRRRTGRGSEVYFLSLDSASDEQARQLADAENAADMVGGVPPSEEDLVSILFDLKQNEILHQSSTLAEDVLEEMAGARRLENRGVKQAPFAVLKSPVVPSILVETAFINQPAEARLLRDPNFQQELADHIARGVLRYLETAPPVARRGASSGALEAGAAGAPGPRSVARPR